MKKRLARGLATAVCLTLPLTGVSILGGPLGASQAAVAPALDLDLETLTGLQAIALMEEGKLTSVQLTQAYIDRINALNKSGPGLNAFAQLNKQALLEAAKADKLRAEGTILSPAMGLPILLKDLIDVEGMYTSNGNYSLRNSYPETDSGLAKKLKESGVVILGKVGLSEYANSFGNQPSGFSNLLGQVVNGIDADQNPSGSSSGTGAAMAAAMSTLGIGTETSGSIISPSRAQSLVGLRPTVGLVPGNGIGPILASQDTAGPMTRTVEDAALTLSAIAGYDAEADAGYKAMFGDDYLEKGIIPELPAELPDYTDALDLDYVKGKKIGYNGDITTGPMKQAYDALVAAGAVMVERPSIPVPPRPSVPTGYEQHKAIDEYYERLGTKAPIKTLVEEVAANDADWHQALKFGNATHRSRSQVDITPGGANETDFRTNIAVQKQLYHQTINTMMDYEDSDPTKAFDPVIGILGSVPSGAQAGYPAITVPMGYDATHRRTLNVSINGAAYDELDLLGIAYVIEQATKLRLPASEVNPSMYRCADTVPAPAFAERGDCNPAYDEIMALLGGEAPAPLPFSLETESAQDLRGRLLDGTLTATALTKAYLYRIALSNAEGPATQAVRNLNTDALTEAAAADAALAAARESGAEVDPLVGLPVLVNDGIDVEGLASTGGSIALQDRMPAADAALVAQLKKAGAIVLGTTNVTELNGMMDRNMPHGYSSLGGQVLLPSDTDKTPAGSSAGAAAATASGLAALTIGMETSPESAQLIAPANAAGIVGLKPTVGLVDTAGILPGASSQDAPGPLTRTVYDAALALNAIVDADAPGAADDYTATLNAGGLAGKRIATVPVTGSSAAAYTAMVRAAQDAGAVTTEVTPGTPAAVPSVVETEFARDLDAYLATGASGGADSLEEIVAYNSDHAVEGLKYQQRGLQSALGAGSPSYEADLAAGREANRAVIDAVLTNGTPADTSDDFDLVMVPQGSDVIGWADRAGYPALTMPAGYGATNSSNGRNPIGVTLIGTAHSERTLLADGHALELATSVRKAPSWTNPSMWRCVPGSTFFTGAYCNTGDRFVLEADPTQGVVQPGVPQQVGVAGTAVSVTTGQPIPLRVLVTGLPAQAQGTVTFSTGGGTLGQVAVQGDGSASLSLAAGTLPVGRHQVTAAYAGDGGTATGQFTVEVVAASTPPTPEAPQTCAAADKVKKLQGKVKKAKAAKVGPKGTLAKQKKVRKLQKKLKKAKKAAKAC